ncbi:MAG: tRNA(Ile)-lysidine synthase [Blastocatellia bacterium]
MLKDARGVVVAVSGGPDSIALLNMLVRLTAGAGQETENGSDFIQSLAEFADSQPFTGPRPPAPGPRLHVAHLNHKLRGADSDEDAEFVRRLAESLSLPLTIECADVRAAAETARRGIEETAREIRYHFLLRVARATGADRIATGHTLSDQAETFLMRLARGAGSRGLAAMRSVSAVPARDAAIGQLDCFDRAETASPDAQAITKSSDSPIAASPCPRVAASPLLIRPLLAITRDEVEAYCDERGLNYRVDATNVAGDFTRNRVRREVLPALQAINPQVIYAIARAAENLAADADALDALAKTLLDAARLEPLREAGDEAFSSGAAYRVTALSEPPAGLQRRMLIEAIRRARAVADTGEHQEISAKHVAAVQSLLDEQASGKHIQLAGGLEVWREFAALVFKRIDEPLSALAARGYAFELSAAHRQVEAGGLLLTLERGQPAHQLSWLINQAQDMKAKRGRDWLLAVLDDAALPAKLIVRPRPRGARVQVSGRHKTIKLKKLMIDHTIPASRRAAWPVVMTTDDRYVWSPGLPPAVDFAARDETRTLAIVRALNF